MKTANKVDKKGLCIGCGICVGLAPHGSAQMVEYKDGFLHPEFIQNYKFPNNFKHICPGLQYTNKTPLHSKFEKLWGPIKEIESGYAYDENIRWAGSSGGGITAILLYLLEKGIVDAVIQTGPSRNNPLKTDTFLNRTKDDILRCVSSRYCPSSPLLNIGSVLSTDTRIAFVGRPCDVSALYHYLELSPEYRKKIVILISFFCASTPSYNATDLLLNRLGTSSKEVVNFWYRGKGWPGFATAVTNNGNEFNLSYEKSWGEILSKQAHFRCKICPDGIGFFADLVFADAWAIKNGSPVFNENDGINLILSRTDIGKKILSEAVNENYIHIGEFDISTLEQIQPSQFNKRLIVGARILALRMCGIFYPKCKGIPIFKNMSSAKLFDLFKNFIGTLKRILVH